MTTTGPRLRFDAREWNPVADPLDMTRVAAGDETAFAALYDQLAAVVYGLVKRVVRDPAQAEEVTQEVFVEVWRQAARFDATHGNVRSWVCVIAHRRAVDRVRSEQAHRDRHERLDQPAGEPDQPDALVVAGDERGRARAALAQLPPPQRQALELAFYGGLTHVEVAERLEVPLGTVKTRIRDGLLRLRATMEREP